MSKTNLIDPRWAWQPYQIPGRQQAPSGGDGSAAPSLGDQEPEAGTDQIPEEAEGAAAEGAAP